MVSPVILDIVVEVELVIEVSTIGGDKPYLIVNVVVPPVKSLSCSIKLKSPPEHKLLPFKSVEIETSLSSFN